MRSDNDGRGPRLVLGVEYDISLDAPETDSPILPSEVPGRASMPSSSCDLPNRLSLFPNVVLDRASLGCAALDVFTGEPDLARDDVVGLYARGSELCGMAL